MNELTSGESQLDRAFAMQTDNRKEALSVAGAILDSDPEQIDAALLIARLLEDKAIVERAARRLTNAYCKRGDLPRATIAAAMLEDDALKKVAEIFGAGTGLADIGGAPPAIPKGVEVPKQKDPEGFAKQVLSEFLEVADTQEQGDVPILPLFAHLRPDELFRFLGAFEIIEMQPEESVIKQGEEGDDAFVVARGMLAVTRKEGDVETTLAALGPGSILGEMALVSDAPRAASVHALEATMLLSIERSRLEALAAEVPAIGAQLGSFCQARMVANLVSHSPLLRAVQSEHREELISRFETRTFEPNEALVSAGQEDEGLFLIASGNVEVVGNDSDGDDFVLATLGPGNVVGEISLVLRRPATATVIATHPTVALNLTRDKFQQIIKEHPALLSELYQIATERDEETRSVVALEVLGADDVILL